MRQLLTDLKTGTLLLEEVPSPPVPDGHLLVETTRSLISAGTERMLIDFGRANLLEKARQQPDKVRQVVEKFGSEGLFSTLESVQAKLSTPVPLGYCNVGRVIAVGDNVSGYSVGDRVASNAHHAEIVRVPEHLAARIPDEVDDEEACFTVVSAIALHGIRLLKPTLGESVAVFGLGLIGQLAVQLLKAAGMRVLGIDPNPQRLDLARKLGADAVHNPADGGLIEQGIRFSGQSGIDAVLIAAAARGADIMAQAAAMSRKRGRIVLTGVVDLELSRNTFYEKELSFQVSCSYGPGRYDPGYELRGEDYPLPYVRWTEQRNFQAVLEQLKSARLQVRPLISDRVPFSDAQKAYGLLSKADALGILLEYPAAAENNKKLERTVAYRSPRSATAPINCAVLGAGNFAARTILPAIVQSGASLHWITSGSGLSAAVLARKFAAAHSSSDSFQAISDPAVNTVFIATRHNLHAPLTCAALEQGKHVYVEKPLCMSLDELQKIEQTVENLGERAPLLMVGFNRRFAPMVLEIRKALQGRSAPLSLTYLCNAGPLPPDSWLNDPAEGGGRLLGEACHFIDLLNFIVGEPLISVSAHREGLGKQGDPALSDTAVLALRYADGSVGNINYFSNGSKAYPKERLEVFSQRRVLVLENFRRLKSWGYRPKMSKRSLRINKGNAEAVTAFLEAARQGRPEPISFAEIGQSMRGTFAVLESLRSGQIVSL